MSFVKKAKEPAISEHIENILKRAFREDVPINQGAFNNTSDLIRIKMQILEIFLNNEDLLKALHHPELSLEDHPRKDLFRYTAIFPFLNVPLDKSDVKNYLCFELHSSGTGKFGKNRLIIRIISHIDDIQTDWGVPRTDLIDLIISEEIDWTNRFGAKMVKISDVADVYSSGYFYRDLVYESVSTNNGYKYINQ